MPVARLDQNTGQRLRDRSESDNQHEQQQTVDTRNVIVRLDPCVKRSGNQSCQ